MNTDARKNAAVPVSSPTHIRVPGRSRARTRARAAALQPQTFAQRDAVRRPATARDRATEVEERKVPDPYNPGELQPANFNRRVDLLEYERAHGRLTESQYLIGRQLELVFDKAFGDGGASPGFSDSVGGNPVHARDMAMIRAVVAAQDIDRLMARVERELGGSDTLTVRQIIGDRMTFGDVAAARGRDTKHGTTYFATRFRDALEDLAQAFAAKGGLADEIRSWRSDPAEPIETDADGIQVPAGRGFTIAGDEGAVGRWRPRHPVPARPQTDRARRLAVDDRARYRAGQPARG